MIVPSYLSEKIELDLYADQVCSQDGTCLHRKSTTTFTHQENYLCTRKRFDFCFCILYILSHFSSGMKNNVSKPLEVASKTKKYDLMMWKVSETSYHMYINIFIDGLTTKQKEFIIITKVIHLIWVSGLTTGYLPLLYFIAQYTHSSLEDLTLWQWKFATPTRRSEVTFFIFLL